MSARVKNTGSKGRTPDGPKLTLPEKDGVQMKHVAAIAAVGFVVGVAWPKLAGVSLVPAVPVDTPAVAASAPADAGSAEPALAATPGTAAAPTPSAAQAPASGPHVEVGDVEVTSCHDAVGKELKSCGTIDADAVLKPRLRALLACPGASQAEGNLSIGLEVDLAQGKVVDVKSGRSTDLPGTLTKSLIACAKEQFENVSLAKVKGDHDRYTLYFPVTFSTSAPESASAGIVAASGQATVRWESALIRKEPDSKSEVRSRLLSGTRIVVTGRKGDWYRVKYDAKGREGWVHGAAIGL